MEKEVVSSHVRSQEELGPVATAIGRWSWMFGRARWEEPLKFRAGGRSRDKKYYEGHAFPGGR